MDRNEAGLGNETLEGLKKKYLVFFIPNIQFDPILTILYSLY